MAEHKPAKQGIVVFAYSEVGHACLKALIDRGENILALFTHEDSPDERQWFRSCAALAKAHGIPVYTVEPREGDTVERIVSDLAPDLIFSFYYRKMIPERILRHARLGAYNMHGSLLPRYRGRAPLNWAIIHGESETGVTLHVMVKEADAGDVIDMEAVSIGPEETAGQVAERIPAAAVRLVLRQIDGLKAGTAPRHVQDVRKATYFGIRKPEDGRIDWRQTARQVFNLVRAVAPPFPGAFTDAAGRRVMIWRARVSEGSGKPGEVLSLRPLVVAAGEGAVEVVHFGFEGEDEAGASEAMLATLKVGDRLGESA
ncbi:formyltransferase [Parvibaculum sedimenti]|uniref:Formyltransferase n=2 Tax=Parvibaculum sedimenti TaxID=2608632 RepID=A0A6N6VI93_9HYPH|nr:formyltransferase [Parvibaculum sedimenti]KAB7738995.1 formyltransferase [Parvibaculum sedimenti]